MIGLGKGSERIENLGVEKKVENAISNNSDLTKKFLALENEILNRPAPVKVNVQPLNKVNTKVN